MTASPAPLPRRRELRFVAGDPAAYLEALEQLHPGTAAAQVHIVASQRRPALAAELAAQCPPRFRCATIDAGALPAALAAPADAAAPRLVVLLEEDAVALSQQLMACVDADDIAVVAPLTAHYWRRRPLYLVSIPKGGTHLLYELAQAFGYASGITCEDEPRPAHWYCVEYSNSHTVARDFFVDTVRRQPFGNRHHPFMRTPAVFIYRNPLDILVSEANYYHQPGKTSFASYLAGRTPAERLECLLGPDWLLGSLRERVGGFIPWLHFENVAAVSFEELVGTQGGGSDALQFDAIWALQLKLHVPGRPESYAQKVFNRDSATFNEGQIGRFAERIPPRTLRRFFAQPQDFMHELGYSRPARGLGALWRRLLARLAPAACAARAVVKVPLHAPALRRRPLVCSGDAFTGTPIMIESDFHGYNIIRLHGRYLGVPQRIGPIDLAARIDSLPPEVIAERSVSAVRLRVQQRLAAPGA